MKDAWFTDHSNIVTLTAYLAAEGYDGKDIAYAVEKPWKYEIEFLDAIAWQLDNEQEDDGIE